MRAPLIALLLAAAAMPASAKAPDYAAAVAFKDRPADAIKLDVDRKPAAVLAFEKLTSGAKAIDILTGTGYYAEIMARVVGPKGSVIAYVPPGPYGERSKAALDALMAREPNVHASNNLVEALAPASLDFAMIHLNYHDFYYENAKFGVPHTDPDKVLAALYKGMKPGGIVAIVDHVGPPGDTRAIVDKLHRIDPETVKADFARAGFKLEAQSDILRNPDDDHSKLVFDPSLRGKTDRFVFRFRKPR